jgi:ABC-2 type transport system permease protein
MVDVGLSTALAVYWFRVPFRGTIATLFLSSALFLIVMLLLGFCISVIAKTQLAASQIALIVTFLPAFLLSGFLFAIEQMPVFIQYVTRVLPARYYVSALKNIFLKGAPVEMLYADLLPLAVFALVLVLLATRAFKKKLA